MIYESSHTPITICGNKQYFYYILILNKNNMKNQKQKLEKLTNKQMTKVLGGAGGGIDRDKAKLKKNGRK